MAIDNIYDGEIASSVLTKLNASINEANKVMNGEVKVQFARSSIDEIRAITGYIDKVQVLDYSTFKLYEFNSNSVATDDGDTVLKPDNLTSGDSGRWIKTVEFVSANTFQQTLVFRDLETFEFTQDSDYKITEVIAESGVTATIKLSDKTTNYTLGNTVSAFSRLYISVDVIGAITVKGELV